MGRKPNESSVKNGEWTRFFAAVPRSRLVKIGRKGGLAGGVAGGKSRSQAKVAMSRQNGKRGGRPRRFPICPHYRNAAVRPGVHRFSPKGRCWGCGYTRRRKL